MSKNQILILALLVVLVIGVFAVLAYLFLFNQEQPTGPVADRATPVPTELPKLGVEATVDVRSAAQATLEVTAQQTASAEEMLKAAMQRMPGGEAALSAENESLRLTMQRIGWLRIGQLWVKVRITNKTGGDLTVDPAHLTLIGQDKNEYSVEESAADLPGALPIVAVEPGGEVTGDVSFRLLLDVAPAALRYDDGEHGALELDILNWILSQPTPASR